MILIYVRENVHNMLIYVFLLIYKHLFITRETVFCYNCLNVLIPQASSLIIFNNDSDRMGGHYKNVITAQPKREDFHRPTNPSGSGLDLPSILPSFNCSKFIISFLFE